MKVESWWWQQRSTMYSANRKHKSFVCLRTALALSVIVVPLHSSKLWLKLQGPWDWDVVFSNVLSHPMSHPEALPLMVTVLTLQWFVNAVWYNIVSHSKRQWKVFEASINHSEDPTGSFIVTVSDHTRSCSCLAGWEPALWCRHRYRSGGGSLLAVTGSWKWPTAGWKRMIHLVQTRSGAAYKQYVKKY